MRGAHQTSGALSLKPTTGLIPAQAEYTRFQSAISESDRNIPAHAGKTSSLLLIPRGTGNIPAHAGKTTGSVPVRISARNIPAHAGKTLFTPGLFTHTKNYPRSHGVRCKKASQKELHLDLSPHMRGKRRLLGAGSTRRRHIPAHAGQTSNCCRHTTGPWTYPRVRGVHLRPLWKKF